MAGLTVRKHVVAVPLPAQGHLNPLMRICHVLASHGILVTFVNVDPVHHRIEEIKSGQQQQQHDGLADGAENIRFAHIPISGLDLASDFRIHLETFFEAQNSILAPLEILIAKLDAEGPPVTCILSDVAMTAPTQKVADKLNLPRIALYPSSASFLLLYYYIIQGEHISLSKVLEALKRRTTQRREVVCEGLPGLPSTIYDDEIPHFKHMVDETVYVWEFLVQVCQQSLRSAHTIVINSFEDLEAPAFMALSRLLRHPVNGVGPLVEPLHKESSTSLWREDEACIHWLDKQPLVSVLYISFGSLTLLSQPQLEEIVAGLLSSQQRFLWVFRPDLMQTGNEENSSTFIRNVLSKSNGKGYVVDWAPQTRVLSHPSVGGFLTHCGWNSTMEAIAHGVPMLCWPYFGDQFLDAKYVVEEWKVGLQFKSSTSKDQHPQAKPNAYVDVERGEVERVIKALMEGEEGRILRKNAMGLKEAGAQCVQAGGSSHNNFQALVSSICCM